MDLLIELEQRAQLIGDNLSGRCSQVLYVTMILIGTRKM